MDDTLDHLESALGERYRVERELGRGGMATVYLAEDLKHRRFAEVLMRTCFESQNKFPFTVKEKVHF